MTRWLCRTKLLLVLAPLLVLSCNGIDARRPPSQRTLQLGLDHLEGAQVVDHGSVQRERVANDRSPPNAGHGGLPRDPHEEEEEEGETAAGIDALLDALDVMQDSFFELWLGTWPTAIDWTAAVLGTHISAMLSTLSSHLGNPRRSADGTGETRDCQSVEARKNLIDRYFSQLMGFYFGQATLSLRHQAYDDMLWVVLGWLETIKFVASHSSHHQTNTSAEDEGSRQSGPWHGTQFVPALAHRVRIFYDLAAKGWDTALCDGGMVWNPRLNPYKNAITNELFITASVAMYLHFPGDGNSSPYIAAAGPPLARDHDPKYLRAALDGYDWLVASNMTNALGLYADGFHIRGDGLWDGEGNHTSCDIRNEMVYTYNQGVLLSGLRDLWESTGLTRYLEDGHVLIASVVDATGWNETEMIRSPSSRWAGLGRDGVLEDFCDASGTCSQDGQTFKGIFFHHLATFCAPLGPLSLLPKVVLEPAVALRHDERCAAYRRWVAHNARAAYQTRDSEGRFGMWWGRSYSHPPATDDDDVAVALPLGAVDYRNMETMDPSGCADTWAKVSAPDQKARSVAKGAWSPDVNDRGRGRTVETQSGGLAVLRALFEIAELPKSR